MRTQDGAIDLAIASVVLVLLLLGYFQSESESASIA